MLHKISTYQADKNLRRIASKLNDFNCTARVASGDLVAIDAMYHMKCLTTVRNKERSEDKKEKSRAVSEAEEDEGIKSICRAKGVHN